jgi:hypothetical protein
MQNDLDKIMQWTQDWKMRLNTKKCKVMYFGKNNIKMKYTLSGYGTSEILEETTSERDLGIQIDNKLKFEDQTIKAVGKANGMISMLKRTFVSRDIKIWSKLYKTYIRPQLEFAISAWNPYRQMDIVKMEKVQKRVTRIPSQLRNKPYIDRHTIMGITSHQDRRSRGDLIQQYKLVNNLDQVKWHTEPQKNLQSGRLRRELVKNCTQRFNFFTNRIVNKWNALSEETKSSATVESFKERFDKKFV